MVLTCRDFLYDLVARFLYDSASCCFVYDMVRMRPEAAVRLGPVDKQGAAARSQDPVDFGNKVWGIFLPKHKKEICGDYDVE